MNGMALYGSVIPFGGTFQTFSDYMRPAIRLAALSHIQTIFVFTHDSIGLGEDGPTHQSVEHLAALRAIPNLALIRPCDAHEVREAWRAALLRNNAPTAFALSRQKVALIDRKKFASANGLHKGGYVLAEAENKSGKAVAPKLILIATGSEVGLAISRGRNSTRPESRPRGLDAVLGILRRTEREIQRIRSARESKSASRNRGRRFSRLGEVCRRCRRRSRSRQVRSIGSG
jgi:transketolase